MTLPPNQRDLVEIIQTLEKQIAEIKFILSDESGGGTGGVGPAGPTGPAGPGVPSAGLEGQILAKLTDTSYDTTWIDNYTGDLRIVCKNDSGATISKGKVVSANGSVGDRIRIVLANNSGSLDAKYVVGVASENIANGAEGYVQMLGVVKNINTTAYAVGDILYIDPVTAGELTKTVPTAPSIDLAIAIVTKVNAASGTIFVRVWSQGQKITQLYDVNTSTPPTNNQVLTYATASGVWIPNTPVLSGTSAGGDLTGFYPNPTIGTGKVTSTNILDGTIVNGDINASAAIALSKLATDPLARANHTGTQTLSTISDAGTAASKNIPATGDASTSEVVYGTDTRLTNSRAPSGSAGGDLTGTYPNPAIASGVIVNADINASAAISLSKLATDPLARANHTGTQTASTISDFDTQVRTSRLDQMAAPTASVSLNSQKITSLLDPTAAQDAATKNYVDAGSNFSTGDLKIGAYITPDSGWLLCDGSAVSRTTYSTLFAKLAWTLGTFTVTIASPGVFTYNSHGLVIGDCVYLTTTGALPTGLSANTNYYVATVPSANTFTLATTLDNALAGTRINTSGTQSGTHTLSRSPYGISGASNFLIPDFRGRAAVGSGDGTASGHTNHPFGALLGKETHSLSIAEMPAHTHTYSQIVAGTGLASGANWAGSVQNTGSTGSGTAHENRTPLQVINYFIKT